MNEKQEPYYDWILRMTKELREDHMDFTSLQAAVNYWALEQNMTVGQVEELIKESPESRQLIMKRYWESRTL